MEQYWQWNIAHGPIRAAETAWGAESGGKADTSGIGTGSRGAPPGPVVLT
jgi:hypothetical protein